MQDDTVIPLTTRRLRGEFDGPGGHDMLVHDLNSPLMFKAYERPLWYEGRFDTKYMNTKHKALVRLVNDKPVCLGVVRDTYNMVQNEELFHVIHEGLRSGLTEQDLLKAKIKDKIAYNGAVCFREYVFPTVQFPSPDKDAIAFRIIVQNGFGTGAIKLYAGAIDFFCTNGLIIGEYTSTYAKHTKGLQLSRFEEAVKGSVQLFWKNRELFSELAGKRILFDDPVKEWLQEKFGENLGLKLFHQYLIEAKTRGRTLWAVYSALTYYSSHTEGDFGLRKTHNDHDASTMMLREQNVRKAVLDQRTFMALAA